MTRRGPPGEPLRRRCRDVTSGLERTSSSRGGSGHPTCVCLPLTGTHDMTADYVSDNLSVPRLDAHFPNMIVGRKEAVTWPYFRKEIDHTWYVDRRNQDVGFLNRD